MNSLEVRDVSVRYVSKRTELLALDRLNLVVAQNEFVSVLGPSGCGKSTLLKLASGLLAPTTGTILLNNEPVLKPRSEVGIVFQQPTLLPWKTVLGNVLAPARAMGLSVKDWLPEAHRLLALVGLTAFADKYPHELSGGMQQRVGIARSLLHDPSMLLMDEPFSALDAMTRDRMMDELQRIWMSARKSVLFITHSIPESVYLSDRVLVMSGRPGHICEEVVIDLPRPRTPEMMSLGRFSEIVGNLRATFDAMPETEN